MKNCFVVAAKMDDGDSPFSVKVAEVFPEHYELIPGYVWVVSAATDARAFDVANALHLVSGEGGLDDASGLVVPAAGYWGYGHKAMWDFMDAPYRADEAVLRAKGRAA